MPAQEAPDVETPLFQQPIIENETNTQELLDESDKNVAHEFIEFGDKLVEAQVDTGETTSSFSWKKLWKYTGPGFLMSIAYLDPGNLEADLQCGAAAGYSMLWILLYAHIAGFLIQVLSVRLGVVTGKHLAQLISSNYSRPVSLMFWIIIELAIIGSDIQEIVGTAIALKIIFGLPLWIGTLMTAMDTLTFMLLQNYGVRKLEAFFMVLIAVMAVCFWIEMIESKPDVGEIFKGIIVPLVPSKAVVEAVALIGAVIMPHNLYLHSALVMTRRTNRNSKAKIKEANFYFGVESALALFCSYLINMAIVVVFASVFYSHENVKTLPGLYDAADVLTRTLGSGARYLWAVGLLAAGQSSTMTGTLAGQYVVEGFFGKIFSNPWKRVAVTRGIAIIPSMLVAVNHFDTMGELLNVLQSLCLPATLIPILKLTSSKNVMGTFHIHHTFKYITWIVAFLLICFNLFMFISYLEELPNVYIGYACGLTYFAFILYLVLLPSGGNQTVTEIDDANEYQVIDDIGDS
ncbi:12009_t:CDS:2 [Cetraspora pellucida]|uniref:12009_t:CDS:1 n=1 Tax=Cetraspora pellucida TaxID=1433469 RepID=A0A9N9D1P8_9GLOM|nr:12009_t:CDS:2 [Cetraspora pellucida]